MRTSPDDAATLRTFLARAQRRTAGVAAIEGAAAGIALSAASALAAALARSAIPLPLAVTAGIGLALAGAALRLLYAARHRRPVARLVERRAPASRNIIVTGAELLDRPTARAEGTTTAAVIAALVIREAARRAAALDLATLFPARRSLAALGAAASFWALALLLTAARPAPGTIGAGVTGTPVVGAVDVAAIGAVDIVVTPPPYAPGLAVSLRDPARVEALAGSRIQLTVRATAVAVTVETLRGMQTLSADDAQTFTGAVPADADGYIAIEPANADGRAGTRRLIGITVIPDHAPRVHVTAPGRDLFLPHAQRGLDLAVQADDDLGLATLRLHFTRVSGFGELFTFVDGSVPLVITRASDRSWTATGRLPLDTLGLEPGDMVVYRASATDHRPGATPSESDTYVVEIAGPGSVAAEGFAIDEEMDRYGLSQAMVIIRTEQLIARSASLDSDQLASESLRMAAEQRSVRAEFVFMMGGELADVDEDHGLGEFDAHGEVEREDDIGAGRLVNTGRLELNRAIREMSQAITALNAAELEPALEHERAALEYLQRAFARSRYILRALTQREQLDLSRRLTGALADVTPDARPATAVDDNLRLTALRHALADLAALVADTAFTTDTGMRSAGLAETLLRIDPSDAALQDVAELLTAAAAAAPAAHTSARGTAARALLEGATSALIGIIRAQLEHSPPDTPSSELGRLEGALGDALRVRDWP